MTGPLETRASYLKTELQRHLAGYDPRRQIEELQRIKILWADREGRLWGLPYERLRPGQSPRDIAEGPVGTRDFIALWGWPLHSGVRAIRDAFFAGWREQGAMPGRAFEWGYVAPVELDEGALIEQAERDTARLRKKLDEEGIALAPSGD